MFALHDRWVLAADNNRPSVAVYAWRVAFVIVGLAPLAAAIYTGGGLFQVSGGIAIFLAYAVFGLALLRLTRYVGLRFYRTETIYGIFAFLLAFGPAGTWVMRWLATVPLVEWLLPVVAVGLMLLSGRIFNRAGTWAVTQARRLLSWVYLVLIGKGILLFCSVLAHPETGVLVGSLGVIAVQCGSVIWLSREASSPLWSLRRIEAASHAAGVTDLAREKMVLAWMYDSVLNRMEQPDFSLLHTMAAEARIAVTSEGQAIRGRLLPVGAFAPRSGRSAQGWFEALDSLLDYVELSAAAEVPGYREARDLLSAHQLIAAAESEGLNREWADAASSYRQAVELLARKQPDLAAATSLDLATLYVHYLDRPEDALDIAARAAADERLSPVTRHRVHLVAAIAANVARLTPEAERHLASAQGVRLVRRHFRAFVAQHRATGMTMGVRVERRYRDLLRRAAADATRSTTVASFQVGDQDHGRPEGLFTRWRLVNRYAGQIEILMRSVSPQSLGSVIRQWPELLGDDAKRAVEIMIGNARDRGNTARTAGLAVIRAFLRDARRHGVDAAVATVSPVGLLPMQRRLIGAQGQLLDPDDPEDVIEFSSQLIQAETAVVDPELVATMSARVESLPSDLRRKLDRFTDKVIDFRHSGGDSTLDEAIETGQGLLDDPRLAALVPDLSLSLVR